MPITYILFQLLLSAVSFILVVQLRNRPRICCALGLVVLAFWLLGSAIEHKPGWFFSVLRLPGRDWVLICNLSLELSAVLVGFLWCAARDIMAKQRAAVLAPLLLAAAMASYAWLFMPVPAHLTGIPEADGYCRQTSDETCGAAAAVTLLAKHGIRTTETDMAALCLTRAGRGTSDIGLYRGLWLAASGHGLRPRYLRVARLQDLAHIIHPCILSVGLRSDCPRDFRDRMIGYGWEPGLRHAVVLLDVEADGNWISVADPSFGRERWPIGDLKYLWDAYAVVLL